MILNVRVIPKARVRRIQESDNGSLKVHLLSPAQDGKANKALIEMLAEYYGVRRRQVNIIQGEYARDKVVEII